MILSDGSGKCLIFIDFHEVLRGNLNSVFTLFANFENIFQKRLTTFSDN